MNVLRICSLACFVAFVSAICLADDAAGAKKQGEKESKHHAAGKIDTNADGKISFDELKAKYPGLTEEKFKARDKNGDGFLTREDRADSKEKTKTEAEPAMQKESTRKHGDVFKRADKDSNGLVTLDEIHAIVPKFPEGRFKELDKNGDGALSEQETQHDRPDDKTVEKHGIDALFARADKDGNERVSYDELTAIAPKFSKEKFDKIDKNHDGVIDKKEMPKAPAGDAEQNVAMLARKADADHDGKVTYEEMLVVTPNLTRDRFNRMDINKDGVLSPADRDKSASESKQGIDEGVTKLLETDADHDGNVTFDEVTKVKPGFPREAFDRADRNKDGVLSAADVKK